MMKTYTDYFFDEPAFDLHDGGYVPLEVSDAPAKPLNVPPLLKPDKETATDVYYTVTAQAGETQLLPGAKTKTWGYNASLLGQTIVYRRGQHVHVTLKNTLPELTTFHWHGANVSGPYVDGGCHAPVYPGESKQIDFTLDQPAATLWLHAHPCPSTAEQVWHGLAAMVIVKDQHEESLPLPRNYGVDDIPVILQDRRFHEQNQWNYRADYDPDGVAGPTAVRLLKALGCELVELYTDINGHFPNHHPDPSKLANLVDLQAALAAGDAEVGIAFDGDGDRLGVVTRDGNVIFPDRQMMLFSADILEKHPGAQIVYDVKCTRRLIPWVKEHGGEPVISCTGHSLVKAKLRETGALFAGEMSGHLFFNDGRWPGFDDGVYAGMRLLEVLSRTENPSAALNALPSAYNTPELQIPVAEGENKEIVAKLQATLSFPDAARTITIDGVRTEWEDGFALVRASNTTPVLVLRFEGDTPEALERIKQTFMQAVSQVVPGLAIPQ